MQSLSISPLTTHMHMYHTHIHIHTPTQTCVRAHVHIQTITQSLLRGSQPRQYSIATARLRLLISNFSSCVQEMFQAVFCLASPHTPLSLSTTTLSNFALFGGVCVPGCFPNLCVFCFDGGRCSVNRERLQITTNNRGTSAYHVRVGACLHVFAI